ncbi:hypothetical protein G5I_13881 [Acromyrmex echinatior]|uniref:2'-5'-oligoadenylate synthetase 1 domain-containing protein n=1 Tax=Acromyrmex echinatior TaxID=103372 RepID=F4X672_ACREC|nr:hypothetical protein G5I_13881 [Acromyrmex echinatior]
MSIRALVLEFKRNLSPGSRDQRLDSRRTERNMQICSSVGLDEKLQGLSQIDASFVVASRSEICPQLPSHLPKHLLWLVARSMKTLDEMTLPNGRNICMSSPSPNSWGRWPVKKIPRVEAKREERLSEHNGSPNKDLANFTELYNSDGATHRDLFASTRKIFCGKIPPRIHWNMLVESSQSIIVYFQPNYDFRDHKISQCTYHRLVAKQQPTLVDSATPRTATDIECNGETPKLTTNIRDTLT